MLGKLTANVLDGPGRRVFIALAGISRRIPRITLLDQIRKARSAESEERESAARAGLISSYVLKRPLAVGRGG